MPVCVQASALEMQLQTSGSDLADAKASIVDLKQQLASAVGHTASLQTQGSELEAALQQAQLSADQQAAAVARSEGAQPAMKLQ